MARLRAAAMAAASSAVWHWLSPVSVARQEGQAGGAPRPRRCTIRIAAATTLGR
jgi:hypothetical protein